MNKTKLQKIICAGTLLSITLSTTPVSASQLKTNTYSQNDSIISQNHIQSLSELNEDEYKDLEEEGSGQIIVKHIDADTGAEIAPRDLYDDVTYGESRVYSTLNVKGYNLHGPKEYIINVSKSNPVVTVVFKYKSTSPSITKPDVEKPTTANETGVVVNATVLNVRSGAGTSYSVVTKIKKGDKVTILDNKSGWYKIKTATNKTGWVSGDYIKLNYSSQNDKPSKPSASKKETGVVVNATVLNVRSGASTKYAVVTKVKKNDTVEILEKKSGWYKVKVSNGKIGWVKGDYIKINTTSSNKPTTPSKTKTKTITANILNVRSGAGTKYNIVTKLKKGDKVTVLENKSGWCKVKTSNNKTGWVSEKYIK